MSKYKRLGLNKQHKHQAMNHPHSPITVVGVGDRWRSWAGWGFGDTPGVLGEVMPGSPPPAEPPTPPMRKERACALSSLSGSVGEWVAGLVEGELRRATKY
ncbi:hypothetical protein E2C01_031350 [Portunus trituberculatus]|uniref:Uncharacterized protein n=1 Tax=Portunus trituberculatus TaxID=210409 RepID=A0A5B7EXD3_PORTR|nr:hypothetical protein [Portunus trituberculatus]